MSPGELVRALRRRWYVLVVAAVLAAAGAWQVLHPTRTYLSTAIVVLKPPVTDTQPNQLANLQPPLAAVSYAAVQQLDSPAGADELRTAGVHGTYRLIPRNSGTSVTPRYLIPSLQIQAEQAGLPPPTRPSGRSSRSTPSTSPTCRRSRAFRTPRG